MHRGPYAGRRDLLLTGLSAAAGLAAGAAGVRLLSPAAPAVAQAAAVGTLHGTVLADPPPTGAEVSVKLDDGKVQRLPYMWPYVPVAGDMVAISVVSGGGNSTAVVIGGHAGRSGNLVVNGDFAVIGPVLDGKAPAMWTRYKVAGGKDTHLLGFASTKLHKNVMILESSDQTGEQLGVSAAFPVRQGETIHGDTTLTVDLITPMNVDVDLRVAWFADINGSYPKPLAQNVLMSHMISADGDYALAGDAKVPAGAAAARVAIRAKHNGPDGTQYQLTVGSVYATR